MSSKRKTKKNASNSAGKALRTIIKKDDDGENSQSAKNIANRGIVYLGNLPPGFYEQQMMDYFSQFGKVTRLRLCRSKKTGKSKGYAYIEFLIPEVAKVVAETMNNYLMHKRLLKARYIAPEDQHMNYFPRRTITESDFPRKRNRREYISNLNAAKTEEQEQEKVRRLLGKVKKIQDELKKYNIVYNFEPVEIPEKMADVVKSFKIYKTEVPNIGMQPNVVKMKLEKSNTTNEVGTETKISKCNIKKPIKIMKSKVKLKKEKYKQSPVKKTKISKSDLENVPLKKFKGTSKLFGVTKMKKCSEIATEFMNPKKMSLIKNEIFQSNQVKLRTAQDIKKGIKNKKK